jgi:hypothetical protein
MISPPSTFSFAVLLLPVEEADGADGSFGAELLPAPVQPDRMTIAPIKIASTAEAIIRCGLFGIVFCSPLIFLNFK